MSVMRFAKGKPAIGTLAIDFPAGRHSILIPAGSNFLMVALLAHEIYEEWGMRIGVEVTRFRHDGRRECLLSLAPAAEESAS